MALISYASKSFMTEFPIIKNPGPLICRANPWTGFYMIGSVIKELKTFFRALLLLFRNQWAKKSANKMRWAIWCHLHNFKNVKKTHGGVLILVKLQELALLQGCSSRFLNCTNCNKLLNASQMNIRLHW